MTFGFGSAILRAVTKIFKESEVPLMFALKNEIVFEYGMVTSVRAL